MTRLQSKRRTENLPEAIATDASERPPALTAAHLADETDREPSPRPLVVALPGPTEAGALPTPEASGDGDHNRVPCETEAAAVSEESDDLAAFLSKLRTRVAAAKNLEKARAILIEAHRRHLPNAEKLLLREALVKSTQLSRAVMNAAAEDARRPCRRVWHPSNDGLHR